MESKDLGIVLCTVTIFISESMPITDLLIFLFFHHSLIVDSSQPSRRTTLINDKDRVPIRNGSWSSSSLWTTQKPQEGADWLTCRNLRFSRKYSNEFLLKGLDRNTKCVSLSLGQPRAAVESGLGAVEEIGWLVTLSIRFFIKCISATPASTHKTGISWSQMLSHLFLLLETSFPLSIFDIHGSCNTQTHTRSLFIHSRSVLVANFSDYFFNRGSQKKSRKHFLADPTTNCHSTHVAVVACDFLRNVSPTAAMRE